MKHYNIYDNNEEGLGNFSDDRGSITDIFYKANMNHACIITNAPGAVRANHYHKQTTQYTYILAGTLYYYSKPVDSEEVANAITAGPGDMVVSAPNEIHGMVAGDDGCVFIAFAQGPRGGEDYENDTFRVDSIIPKND
jgi:quercetin dioxygenase-like cupin family protein